MNARLPSLFVSHGSPMFALESGATGPLLRSQGQAWRSRVKGVVLMSPHWMSHGVSVMSNPQPPTWHDFGGFPQPLYELEYPAPGDADLGQQAVAMLGEAGIAAKADPRRPLDHGAWVPLMHLWPAADVPVVQLSLPHGAGPAEVLAMGRALAPLRSQGVLLIGSGGMTHNLGEFFSGRPPIDAPALAYVGAFARWVEDALLRGDTQAMLNYAQLAPHAARAHPTDEHFLPLFFALGAAEREPVSYLSREVMYGMLAMDAFTAGAVN